MEQGVIGFAAGLATTGKIPFVAAIAPFVTARPFEMFRNDLGYMRQNVKVVGRCGGLTYSDLGPTHQSLDDIALIRTIPGVTVVNPGDPVEIEKAVFAIADHVGPVYMKIGNPAMPDLHGEGYEFQLGKADEMMSGEDVAIIATGTALPRAHAAAEMLAGEGVSVRLINMHTVKPLDEEAVVKTAREVGRIVTVEEHYLAGGLGGAVAEVLARSWPTQVKMIGIDDRFGGNGPYEELLGLYGLRAEQIAQTVREFLEKGEKG
jgi:transketolase